MENSPSNPVNPTALGLAAGFLWGCGMAVLGLVSRTGWGERARIGIADVYLGYDETNTGIVIGWIWGFVDALVAGVLLGWLYNVFDRIT